MVARGNGTPRLTLCSAREGMRGCPRLAWRVGCGVDGGLAPAGFPTFDVSHSTPICLCSLYTCLPYGLPASLYPYASCLPCSEPFLLIREPCRCLVLGAVVVRQLFGGSVAQLVLGWVGRWCGGHVLTAFRKMVSNSCSTVSMWNAGAVSTISTLIVPCSLSAYPCATQQSVAMS